MTYRETRFQNELEDIRQQGLYKAERVITTPQGVELATTERGQALNFCANNYLGLANHPEIVEASIAALRSHGFGMASVRFICGTQDLHKELEQAIAAFLGTEDAILYSSCFDANTGLFETLLGEEDAVISDALNHASIIDGIRLCKAARFRYAHGDMSDLERQLQSAKDRRTRLIVTDGVFSMDGDIARLDEIVELAEKYQALFMVDDSHGTGVIGATGRGSAEHCQVLNRIDIFTSTFGKALGGGAGGFTASRREIVDLLRQRSRPYLFSNTLAPPLVAGALKAVELITRSGELRERLWENTAYFRRRMLEAGFEIRPGEHPIVPIMLYQAHLAQQMATALLGEGIYVIGFSYPVVPKGEARIRIQITAAHTKAHLDQAVEAFSRAGRTLGVIR
ncbi:MAG TPA: glycine C-acetyltransferase [Methylococcaceae bacterium]|nr:glycine C-acetyltransferase [Methylococcaceae bacterium]